MKTKVIEQSTAWLLLRGLALPFIVIVSFFVSKDSGARCISYLTPELTPFTHRPTGHMVRAVGLGITGPPAYVGAIFLGLLLLFLAICFVQLGPKRYRLRRHFAQQQGIVSLISTVVTLPIYGFLYLNSQWKHTPNWSCGQDGILHGGNTNGAHFGLGIAPIVLTVFIAIYLGTSLLPYLLIRNNAKRVGGKKTKDLFQ